MEEIAKEKIKPFLKDEKGDIVQTTITIGILGILAFVVLSLLKTPIQNVFEKVKGNLESI